MVRRLPVLPLCLLLALSACNPAAGGTPAPVEPSRASAATAPLRAASASSRSARYRLDLPVPLAPVTTVSGAKGTTRCRSER